MTLLDILCRPPLLVWTRRRYDSFFILFNPVSESFDSDSTHDSQWLPKNWFKSAHDSKWLFGIWFKSTQDWKDWNIDSNQLMTQVYCLFNIISRLLLNLYDFLDSELKSSLNMTFLGFPLKYWLRMTLFGLSTQSAFRRNWFQSSHDSTSISETWIDSTNESSAFPGTDSESTYDSSGFPRHCFRSTHGSSDFPGNQIILAHHSKCFPTFNLNRLMTQAKNIWFWVDSWFDFESYPCLECVKRGVEQTPHPNPERSERRWISAGCTYNFIPYNFIPSGSSNEYRDGFVVLNDLKLIQIFG